MLILPPESETQINQSQGESWEPVEVVEVVGGWSKVKEEEEE